LLKKGQPVPLEGENAFDSLGGGLYWQREGSAARREKDRMFPQCRHLLTARKEREDNGLSAKKESFCRRERVIDGRLKRES